MNDDPLSVAIQTLDYWKFRCKEAEQVMEKMEPFINKHWLVVGDNCFCKHCEVYRFLTTYREKYFIKRKDK